MCIEIVFLGTGSSANPKRGQSSIYISIEEKLRLVVDFGCRAYNILREMGLRSKDIDLFIFTHTHYDHICGLPLMLFSESFNKRPTIKIVSDDLTWDNILSLRNTVIKTGVKYKPVLKRVFKPPILYMLPYNISLELFPVKHTVDAYGVMISNKDYKIVISGDTAPSINVMKRVLGATLAIHEATLPIGVTKKKERLEGHTSVKKAIKIISSAERGVLYHLSEKSEKDAISLASIERGKIYVPEDRTRLKLC